MIERRTKEDKPVLAICYDFDKTLSPDDMQAQGYIQVFSVMTYRHFGMNVKIWPKPMRWTLI